MKRRKKTSEEESSLDLLERAFHLLRTTPAHITAWFYLGSIPFILAALFFLVDMSTNPFAARHCSLFALSLSLLYLWMRSCQSLFCRGLNAAIKNSPPPPLTARGFWKLFTFHAAYSSWMPLVLPATALIAVPFGWVYAYANNLCIVDPVDGPLREHATRARALSIPWPKQNHLLITLLFTFGFVLFINIAAALVQLPGLLKSLCGIESEFSKSFHWILTPTFFAFAIGLTYLAIEPFVKATYALRAHACESIRTGEDLRVELKRLPPVKRRAAAAALLALICYTVPATPLRAQPLSTAPAQTIPAPKLDQSIDQVMKNPEFTWRMPNIAPQKEEEKGFLQQFLAPIAKWLEKTSDSIWEAIDRFFNWLDTAFNHSPKQNHSSGNSSFNPSVLKGISLLLLLILAGVLAVVLFRVLRSRYRPPQSLEEAGPPPEVDLDDENIVATLLEEDEWIAMARQLAAAGELRKAMRAWFLAGIASLARRDLLGVKASKSNMDYRRELIRRTRRLPAIAPLFCENISLFERAWYGLHTTSLQDLNQMEQNTERMRSGFEA